MRMGESLPLLIGTSGWSYDEWVGPFYRDGRGMLRRYVEVFPTVEINSTFYRYPTSRMVRGWYRAAPPGFVYAVKLPKVITHDKWLRLEEGVEEDLERFLDLMRPLAEKLGPILIQLRPKFSYERHIEDLERFLDILPEHYEWAVEFRHPSWMRGDTWKLLRSYGVAYTIVDEPLLPPEVEVTADFAYIRWHGHGRRIWYDYEYSEDELENWVPKVREAERRAEKVYGYFNNHFSANAVKNAIELLKLLGEATPEQLRVLKRIKEFREQLLRPIGIRPLEAYGEGLGVADLLLRFTTTSRLIRAEGMDEGEIEITRADPDYVEAYIRGYTIEIDAEGRVIRHDCDDWRKGLDEKRMCKHLARLFLSLPEELARGLLERIWEERDRWRFEAL
ncbi:MAG TPA: DUF72 domain-containing protein [Candidatus Bathyarchaeota archaeon]|nr:DUF72 domain-containing protein [Candidatus Bathyarchaeota archaeon]